MMKITKKEYLNSIFWLLGIAIFWTIFDYLFNKKISLYDSIIYIVLVYVAVFLLPQIGTKYYKERFKTMKIETIRKKYPLYFVNEKLRYFFVGGVGVAVLLFIWYFLFLPRLIIWSGLSKAFLVSFLVFILLAFFIALAFYYLYKSEKITKRILIILVFVYFLIIPVIFITRFSILLVPALIFTAISALILIIYDIYVMTMYTEPALMAIASRKVKRKQQALKSEKAIFRHGKRREKARKSREGSYSV